MIGLFPPIKAFMYVYKQWREYFKELKEDDGERDVPNGKVETEERKERNRYMEEEGIIKDVRRAIKLIEWKSWGHIMMKW